MKHIFILIITFLLCLSVNCQTIGLIEHNANSLDDGYVLFAPLNSTTTYLIDKCGKQTKTWPSNYRPGQACYLLPDGSLLRTGNSNNNVFNVGGTGGIVEKIDWNGELSWSYTVSDASKCQHHDVKALPNGNILIIAWELKTKAEAIAAGRNPSLVGNSIWSEQILEVQPTGTNAGIIVWEWHLWDHLIQDYDITKSNYGMVASNPQLININYNANANNSDWIHLNSIDYNPVLDQIVLSSHNFDEIWIIDHSTNTSQAASDKGGNSGNGGDILYRWGNPAAYKKGTTADQKFFGQHNAYWIESGYPFENQIMVFNNGLARPGGNYSTVEIIDPPVDGYNYIATLPYLPALTSWNYNYENTNDLFSKNISGAQQLPNGNVLICSGESGTFTEITTSGTQVWKYINPVNNTGAIIQGTTNPIKNNVFRCSYYPTSYSGFDGHTLNAGNTIENTNPVSNSCNLFLGIENNSSDDLRIFPNPAKDFISIYSPTMDLSNAAISLFDNLAQPVFELQINRSAHDITISTVNIPAGMYNLQIRSGNSVLNKKILILR
ncbi:MAG: aryl-sulfate sulfotransferase [Saprospiraceae bacterium]